MWHQVSSPDCRSMATNWLRTADESQSHAAMMAIRFVEFPARMGHNFEIVPPQRLQTGGPEALATGKPVRLSPPPSKRLVQAAPGRATPCGAPPRHAAAAGWGSRRRCAQAAAAGGGGQAGTKGMFRDCDREGPALKSLLKFRP
jgi:hypothetical protein